MKILRNFLRSENAVSEVIGFVTIIGILVLSFSIIGIAGYPMLKNAQEAKYIENTKQSFVLMADDINKVVFGDAPSRSIEMKMYGGRLGIIENGNIKINVTSYNLTNIPPIPEEITIVNQSLQSIENSIGDVVVAYENTGVWVRYPGDSVLNIYRPLVVNQSKALIIPVVKVEGMASIAGAGMSRVQVKGVPIIVPYNNLSYINITITGDYAEGWKNYFENRLKWECTGHGSISCKSDSTNYNVYILNIRLDTNIE